MIVNLQGSVIAMWLQKQLVDKNGNMIDINQMKESELSQLPPGLILAGMYSMFMIAMLVIGVILLIRRRKYLVFFDAPLDMPKKIGRKSLYGTVGVISFLTVSIIFNLLMLFS